jgi:ketosteroid isomerase-like protein
MIRKEMALLLVLLTAGCVQSAQRDKEDQQIVATIIAMEESALDRWGKGDPSGFLEISAPDVVYFDPSLDKRLDGLDALKNLYEGLRGKLHVDHYELVNPQVQLCGDCAVLTFNYIGYSGGGIFRWNCTEVYRHRNDRWEIIQTHWSFTKPSK